MDILVLDEDYLSGYDFLKSIFSPNKHETVVLTSMNFVDENFPILKINHSSLSDISITVNELRVHKKARIIIHRYLPDILLFHPTEEVLKMILFWKNQIRISATIEFYLLPYNTFYLFEKIAKILFDLVLKVESNTVNRGQEVIIKVLRDQNNRITRNHYSFIRRHDGLYYYRIVNNPQYENTNQPEKSREHDLSDNESNYEAYSLEFNEYIFNMLVQLLTGSCRKDHEFTKELEHSTFSKVSHKTFPIIKDVKEKLFPRRKIEKVPKDLFIIYRTIVNGIIDYYSYNEGHTPKWVSYLFELVSKSRAFKYVKKKDNFIKVLCEYLKEEWSMDVKISGSPESGILVEARECYFCKDFVSSNCVCEGYFNGVIGGFTSVILNKKAKCFELSCKSRMDDYCSFITIII